MSVFAMRHASSAKADSVGSTFMAFVAAKKCAQTAAAAFHLPLLYARPPQLCSHHDDFDDRHDPIQPHSQGGKHTCRIASLRQCTVERTPHPHGPRHRAPGLELLSERRRAHTDPLKALFRRAPPATLSQQEANEERVATGPRCPDPAGTNFPMCVHDHFEYVPYLTMGMYVPVSSRSSELYHFSPSTSEIR